MSGWSRVLDLLPSPHGRIVLDLGCGAGDRAAELVDRGARVVGVDMNEQLIREARSRRLPGAEFRTVDLRTFPDLGVTADGLWCSFIAAYFPDLTAALEAWARHLRPGGWIALTEIDDLFGHEPLADHARELFEAYAREALAAGRYDFRMGGKLREYVERAAFTVSELLTLDDRELSFHGPADPDVVAAWGARFDRMELLRDFCGPSFASVREAFLDCLTRADHRSTAKVYCCIAR